MFDVILAVDKSNGIGKDNKLPWKIKEELEIFKQKTENSIIIVGKTTAQYLPHLENREILCLSRTGKIYTSNNNMTFFRSLQQAIDYTKTKDKKVFIAGGSELYNYVFFHYKHLIDIVHISILHKEYDCDSFILEDFKNYYIVSEKKFQKFNHYEFKYTEYGENQYLNLVKDIIKNGEKRIGRNGETISLFGKHLKFDLTKGFPLLTTKKMFTRGIIEELLFFLRGDTDTKILEEKNVNIWKGNTSREFLDSIGMKLRNEGVMGPMYGYQWRFFNANYDEEGARYKNDEGLDQLKNLLENIKKDPQSRRHLLTTYNPEQASEGVLYPCHSIVNQFYVSNGYLDMFCYNRSNDIGLGLPFNIASSSLLLSIIAKLTNLIPRFLNLSIGDAHIYPSHIEPLKQQIERKGYAFPKLTIGEIDLNFETLGQCTIERYNSYDTIKMEMIK